MQADGAINGETPVSMVDPDEFAGRVALVTAAAGKGIGSSYMRI